MKLIPKNFFSYENGLSLLIGLFLILYLLLCYFNRFAADDFFFMQAEKQYGTFKTVQLCYETYSGRWLAYSLTTALLSYATAPFFLFLFGCATFILLFWAVFVMLKKTFSLLGISYNRFHLVQFSILFCASFLFASIDIGESWFWYTSVISYLLSLIALIFLILELVHPRKSILSFILTIVLSLYIGAASESFATISGLVIFLLLLASHSKNKKIQTHILPGQSFKIALAFIALSISFGITAAAPGNTIRLAQLPHPTFFAQALAPFKSLFKVSYLTIVDHSIGLILLSFPWFLLGHSLKSKTPISLLQFFKNGIKFIPSLLLLGFIILLPASLILSETPPARALSQFSFLVVLIVTGYFFFAGQQIILNPLQAQRIKISSLIASVLFISITLFLQINKARKYASAYDKRMEIIQDYIQTNGAGPIELEKLPPSGYLYSAEIASDTANFKNIQLQRFLELKKAVRVKADEESELEK